ncbi:uncharacterized protein [Dysidea avara]|uniref:uncharacterized protein n=1 Tax=Dysidea avara TaxID=196820 RepID=UPI003325E28B
MASETGSVRIASKKAKTPAESYALVDFVDEQCYGVVPTQRILHCNVIELSHGDDLTILWDDNKEYFARFIVAGSKTFCEAEEDRLCESNDSDNEPAIVEEDQQRAQEDKENVSPVKKVGKGKRKQTGEFLIKTGKPPLRSVPLNVRGNATIETEENFIEQLNAYTGQDIELYSSDPENDEFFRCCAMVEEGFGRVNKSFTVPFGGTSNQTGGLQSSDPIHYTGGVQQLEFESLHKMMGTLGTALKQNEEKQTKQYTELKMDVGKTFQELQKTLSFIMGKMVNTSRVESDGFATPSDSHEAVQSSRPSVLPFSLAPAVSPTCYILDTVPSTTSVPSVAPFPSCNPTVAIASTPNPIVANPMTSVASPISASMSPFSPTFIEDTGPSLDSTL